MRVLKTVVATGVIVFALTTVAMAGVQRLGGGAADAQPASVARPATVQPATTGDVMLSAQQFAALLRAVRRDGEGTRDPHAARTHEKSRTHARTRDASHGRTGSGSHAAPATARHAATQQTATHHAATHQAEAHHTTTHAGAHHGSHGGGEAGCD